MYTETNIRCKRTGLWFLSPIWVGGLLAMPRKGKYAGGVRLQPAQHKANPRPYYGVCPCHPGKFTGGAPQGAEEL